MDLFSQKIKASKLEIGDHIYSWRKMKTYSHHGIFIGEGKLIHFVNPGADTGILHFSAAVSSSSSYLKTLCTMSNCGSEKVDGSGVRMSCIDCFVALGSLYLYKYEASHRFVVAKLKGGTCTTARSDPPQEVIHRATYLYENGYPKYDLKNNNCEDFALYCKTGLWSNDKSYQGRSSQINRLGHLTKVEDETITLKMPWDVNKDLGMRKDVVKVPVEELSAFRLRLLDNHQN